MTRSAGTKAYHIGGSKLEMLYARFRHGRRNGSDCVDVIVHLHHDRDNEALSHYIKSTDAEAEKSWYCNRSASK